MEYTINCHWNWVLTRYSTQTAPNTLSGFFSYFWKELPVENVFFIDFLFYSFFPNIQFQWTNWLHIGSLIDKS